MVDKQSYKKKDNSALLERMAHDDGIRDFLIFCC